MSLERLLERLQGDARAEAEAIMERARLQAETLTAEAKLKVDAERSAIVAVAIWEARAEARRIVSNARRGMRMDILRTKEMLLAEAHERATGAFAALPPDEFGEWLGDRIAAAADSGREEVLCSRYDRQLIAGLMDRVNEKLVSRGLPGELRLSAEDARVARGCVLREGGLETNLSVEAAIERAYRDSEDSLAAELFGEDE
ncbi:MAG: V-type ATP synthase subunit E [Candidatus Geothermincolia bacterium]